MNKMKKLMDNFPLNIDEYVTVVDRNSCCKDTSYFGDVLQIKVINEPYILAERKSKYNFENGDIVRLDMREDVLMKITDEYVNVATSKDK